MSLVSGLGFCTSSTGSLLLLCAVCPDHNKKQTPSVRAQLNQRGSGSSTSGLHCDPSLRQHFKPFISAHLFGEFRICQREPSTSSSTWLGADDHFKFRPRCRTPFRRLPNIENAKCSLTKSRNPRLCDVVLRGMARTGLALCANAPPEPEPYPLGSSSYVS